MRRLQLASTNFTVSGKSAAGITIPMSPAAGGVTIQVQFNPPVAGIQWYLDGGSAGGDQRKRHIPDAECAAGNHILQTPDTANFAAVAQTIAVGSCRSFTITLVSKNASGSIPNAANKNTVYDPATDPLNMPGLVQDVSEDTYDNTAIRDTSPPRKRACISGTCSSIRCRLCSLRSSRTTSRVRVLLRIRRCIRPRPQPGARATRPQLRAPRISVRRAEAVRQTEQPVYDGKRRGCGNAGRRGRAEEPDASVQSPTAANQALSALAGAEAERFAERVYPGGYSESSGAAARWKCAVQPIRQPALRAPGVRPAPGDRRWRTTHRALARGVKLGPTNRSDQSGQVIAKPTASRPGACDDLAFCNYQKGKRDSL